MTAIGQSPAGPPGGHTPASLPFRLRRPPVEPYQLAEGVLRLDQALPLSGGDALERPRLAWRRLGPADAPAVLVLGGISASRYAWQPDGSGWWQGQIGAGRALDPARYQILSLDYLGGNGDSESPRHREGGFPPITTADQAAAIAALLAELGLARLHSVIGASYGGMVALALCERHPALTRRALVLCAAHEAWPLATGWRHIQREIVSLALRQGEPEKGLELARALAVTTYRSGEEFAGRFAAGPEGGCPDYLMHQGRRFAERFDPEAFLCLSRSIDTHRVNPASLCLPIDLVGFSSDQIVPPAQLESLRASLALPGRLELIDSIYGHDAFLKAEPEVGACLRRHLDSLSETSTKPSLEYAA